MAGITRNGKDLKIISILMFVLGFRFVVLLSPTVAMAPSRPPMAL
jgi:hypothetical protein